MCALCGLVGECVPGNLPRKVVYDLGKFPGAGFTLGGRVPSWVSRKGY